MVMSITLFLFSALVVTFQGILRINFLLIVKKFLSGVHRKIIYADDMVFSKYVPDISVLLD